MSSKIKVDNINKVSDDSSIIKKCGSTTTVGSGSGNTIVVCGSTVTIGRCGGAVNLASGATQTGFGQASSSVLFCTTAKTSPFTAEAGKGYFVNTCGGSVTVTLPATPSAGNVVKIKDYAGTSGCSAKQIFIARNGSKINGTCQCSVINTNDLTSTLIYVDGTKGWMDVSDTQTDISGVPTFINATGGTITTCGDYKIHTFTSSGCFAIASAPTPANNIVSYVVVAGGGGGGQYQAGGGGGGGFREGKNSPDPYSDSPLDSGSGLTVAAGTYPVTVGAGGAKGLTPAQNDNSGANSIFSTITSAGGGNGGAGGGPEPFGYGNSGGSGGGGGEQRCGSAGNTPPVSPPQGQPGGNSTGGSGAGGGGATGAGSNAPSTSGAAGGAGASTSITGSSVERSGGGGGGRQSGSGGAAGPGGGGAGGGPSPPYGGSDGTVNTGGGGGGGGSPVPTGIGGGAGGSGRVLIRYRYQ